MKKDINYLKHAVDCYESKLSPVEYCAAHNLDHAKFAVIYSSFVPARKTSKSEAPSFIELKPKSSPCSNTLPEVIPSVAITINSSKGSVISLPSTLAAEQLNAIFTAIGQSL